MRVRRWASAILGATALVAGLGAAAGPASAASSAPSRAASAGLVIQQVNPTTFTKPYVKVVQVRPFTAPYRICTNGGTFRCMTAEGQGFQFQMQQSGYSTFTSTGGSQGSMFETPNGLCPHAKDGANGWVVDGEAGCGITNAAYEWSVSNRLESAAYSGRYLAVLFNNQDGAKTTTQLGTGAWYLGLYLS